jgi:hypothetical protein
MPHATITASTIPTGSSQQLKSDGASSSYHVDYVIGSGSHAQVSLKRSHLVAISKRRKNIWKT